MGKVDDISNLRREAARKRWENVLLSSDTMMEKVMTFAKFSKKSAKIPRIFFSWEIWYSEAKHT